MPAHITPINHLTPRTIAIINYIGICHGIILIVLLEHVVVE